MRSITITIAALILFGVASLIGARVSAPYRHKQELANKLRFFEGIISELKVAPNSPANELTIIPVPINARDRVYSIIASRSVDDHLAVEFLTGGGFPVKHRGFLFLSAGRIEDYPKMAARWPRRTPLREQWLYIGD